MAESQNSQIITRFAPSPTGFLHIGGVRTALYNYLLTKQQGGKMLLRIEDTDKERNEKRYEENIFESFKWLGFEFAQTFIQSHNVESHKNHLKKMIDAGTAYISKEEPKEEGQRSEVIRFKNPNKKVVFRDLIRGQIEFDTTELGDFVIAKSLEEPLYHLAVVIDDFEMGVTHVIRGEEHISNTPRQILIQEAIGAPMPTYAHLPIILAKDKSKLSKRKHGETVSIPYYIEHGYLPEALINYLALLGWNPGTEQEIFSLDELVNAFDFSKVQKSGAVFDEEKLKWFNKEYLKKYPQEKMERIAKEYLLTIPGAEQSLSPEKVSQLTPIIFERISTFGDIKAMIAAGELGYYFNKPQYDIAGLLWKGKGELALTAQHLKKVAEILTSVPDASFTKEAVKEAIWPYAEEVGRGDVLWPTRFSLSGRDKSPDPFILAEILGKIETINRINDAIGKIGRS